VYSLSIFGTHSDAGKSTLTWLIGRLLQEQGYTVTPFKAQNVSNNAHVADDGSEIAVAQYFQARALGVPTSWHTNPVLLKSGRGNAASLIVRGRAVSTPDVREYYRDIDRLKPTVEEAFEHLQAQYDIVIAEGAGSPVELNLMDKDLSNLYIAQRFDTRIILVADIEKGGVFASIYGVYHLLPEPLRRNVIGVVINKFRGDRSLFDEGVRIIERDFGIPVLGVLPYVPFALGLEDSQSLWALERDCSEHIGERIGVIAYPTMSNYNDFEPLFAREEVCINFVRSAVDLSVYDTVILPGSKLVIDDLCWLKRTGLFAALQKRAEHGGAITGICGGYEMMFERLIDEAGIESAPGTVESGLGLIDDVIRFVPDKIVRRHGERYEIHHGISERYPLEYRSGHLYGTFEHGLFADKAFARYTQERIAHMTRKLGQYLKVERIIKTQ
jgi:adenosylcobyric acid synthase